MFLRTELLQNSAWRQRIINMRRKPEPENDLMGGNIDESTKPKLRLIEIEKEEIRLKLANSNTNNTDMNYQ